MASFPWDTQPDAEINTPAINTQSSNPEKIDRAMMQRCIQLARLGWGKTAPNPLVGAVVVNKEGKIIGEGFHPQAGQPHAEIFALREAGELARGATIYVNLEPCNHYGRTPPCSEALVQAGVARVVVGMVDPNPLVAGGGIQRLQQAGIEVVVGVEEAACRKLNEAFIHRILYKRPFGIYKYAMTLDGKIATSTGHSNWVSGEEARNEVHHLRVGCDAVIVGGNTVISDNPLLTNHHTDTHNPLRVVMSRSLNLPENAHLWDTSEVPTLVFTEPNAAPDFQRMLEKKAVAVVQLEPLTPAKVMEYLYNQQMLTVLWECGGKLAARAIAEGSVQKIWAFIAPKIVGGVNAPSPVGDLGLVNMTEALNLERVSWRSIGADYLVEGYLPLPEPSRFNH